MAVDTEAKRWSMLALASGAVPSHVFNPDTSGLSSIEKITVLQHYGGIPWTVEVVASAAVSAPALTEPLLVNGGQVITITLTNDTWVAAGNPFDQVRQIIMNGLTSAQSEVTGWNKKVRDKESITSVVRTSNTVVTITLSAAPDYDITVNEFISVTIPDEALVTRTTPLIATPTIDVTATAALLAQHFVLFRSTSKSATFLSESFQGATFQSESNATAIIQDTPQPLGFLLTEDGGIILQENDLPIALE